ncbi:hypothetical protein [Comamonas sp. JC664]|uniref:hypothetical protein n=1 Tax=Comamonas sp. JC664 TaxID=2801917 RepID=UPI00174DCB72|nr:hypothetical protein [Comamonas sp. JC664]MBL0693898.1 hypothetical protein [Comamonas sp. JC664]GHH04542.1 hypothetical protein GCM10012319_74060 [Comamonas sp. KCTC 72670]
MVTRKSTKRTARHVSLLADALLKGPRRLAKLAPAQRKALLTALVRDENGTMSEAGTELRARVESGHLRHGTPGADVCETFDNSWDMYIGGGVQERLDAFFPDEEQGGARSGLHDEVRSVSSRLYTAMAHQDGVSWLRAGDAP